jgi:predicted DNA-binding mobile mystery protein A
MQAKHKTMARKQLDETLTRLAPLKKVIPPPKGWIRAIRETLGMTGGQLAERLQTNKQRVSRIEQDEILDKLTLATLRGVADSLDCTLVYGLVPKHSLEQTIQDRATLLAQNRLTRSHHLRLEKTAVSQEAQSEILETRVKDLVEEMPKALWEKL